MDSWTVEIHGNCLDEWKYEFYYGTHDDETAEKIKVFFEELMREKYGKID